MLLLLAIGGSPKFCTLRNRIRCEILSLIKSCHPAKYSLSVRCESCTRCFDNCTYTLVWAWWKVCGCQNPRAIQPWDCRSIVLCALDRHAQQSLMQPQRVDALLRLPTSVCATDSSDISRLATVSTLYPFAVLAGWGLPSNWQD